MGKGEALLLITLMLAGGFLPSIPLGGGSALNIGGAFIPAGICIYLLKADTLEENSRSDNRCSNRRGYLGLDRLLPITPGAIGYELDPLYLPAVLAVDCLYCRAIAPFCFIGGYLEFYC